MVTVKAMDLALEFFKRHGPNPAPNVVMQLAVLLDAQWKEGADFAFREAEESIADTRRIVCGQEMSRR